MKTVLFDDSNTSSMAPLIVFIFQKGVYLFFETER